MERKRITRPALVLSLGTLVGCTGYVQPQGSGESIQQPAAAPEPSAQPETAAAPVSLGAPQAWFGGIGTWCGPAEQRSLWLSATPEAAACEAASANVYHDGSRKNGTGLRLELPAEQLQQAPLRANVRGRYCTETCVDVDVTLDVERFEVGKGLSGAWVFTTPSQGELRGRVDASWCNWDDFLPAHPAVERLARDIRIKEVSVYQGVKVPIVRDGAALATRNADLVQAREALLRVFVEPGPGYQSRLLSARVTLQNEGEEPRYFEQSVNVSGPSTDIDGASTFNLALPKDAFSEGTQYAVELREAARCTALSGTASGARFPEQGLAPVGARATGPIKVMLVPVRYEADGSGRLPDTSGEQLAQMAKRLYSMYPTTEVMLSVRSVVGTARTDLSDMLDQLRELRAADAPPSDLAYYGMVRQAETFGDYCQGTCTTGIAGFGSMNGTSGAGMGIGYANTAANTFVHELGHIYRRPHAPCGGAGAPDESYPYPSAGLGSWGYDVQTHELFEPTTHLDFMSYCSPDWISDYNYQQILERIVVVNQRASLRVLGTPEPRAFRTLRVAKTGTASWGLDLHPRLDPPGERTHLKALDAQGAVLADVSAFVEEGPDGEQAYFVPAGHTEWHAIQVPGGAALPYAAPTLNEPFRR
jgi:hypothetical protein